MGKVRSPNYPAIDLGTALGLAQKIYDKAQRHKMPIVDVITDLWGYKVGSYANQCAGALRAFGLVDWNGTGDRRMVYVTPHAAKILDNHPERRLLLRGAALAPKIHESIWSEYEADGSLPPDETLRNYLLHEHEPPFNRGKVDGFIKQFRQTLSFADIEESGIIHDEIEGDPDDAESVGDSGTPEDRNTRRPPNPKDPTVKEDVFTLESGEAVLRWPTSMSRADFEDFEAWLEIVKRKALRLVMTDQQSSQSIVDAESGE